MARIQPLQNPSGKAEELLGMVQKKLGMIPNMMKTMAHSPAVLEAYLNFSGALNGSSIPLKIREQIALLAAKVNCCDYCAAAHSVIGQKAGLTAEEVESSFKCCSTDPKTQAMLSLAKAILEKNGNATEDDIANARKAGLSDVELVEIPAIVGLNVFTNYFNHVVDPEIDFPQVTTSCCSCC